jgi:hypothetical protein
MTYGDIRPGMLVRVRDGLLTRPEPNTCDRRAPGAWATVIGDGGPGRWYLRHLHPAGDNPAGVLYNSTDFDLAPPTRPKADEFLADDAISGGKLVRLKPEADWAPLRFRPFAAAAPRAPGMVLEIENTLGDQVELRGWWRAKIIGTKKSVVAHCSELDECQIAVEVAPGVFGFSTSGAVRVGEPVVVTNLMPGDEAPELIASEATAYARRVGRTGIIRCVHSVNKAWFDVEHASGQVVAYHYSEICPRDHVGATQAVAPARVTAAGATAPAPTTKEHSVNFPTGVLVKVARLLPESECMPFPNEFSVRHEGRVGKIVGRAWVGATWWIVAPDDGARFELYHQSELEHHDPAPPPPGRPGRVVEL